MALPDQGMFDLGGKVVLVTGAAQGLGKAVAEACAQQGTVVIIVDVEDQLAQQVASEIQQATGQSVTAHCCDVRCTDQVQELVATVITQHDRIDVLVNNAGIHRRVDPLDISAADVQAIFDVNLVGCLNMASAVGKVMIQQQAGSIINVSALGGGVISSDVYVDYAIMILFSISLLIGLKTGIINRVMGVCLAIGYVAYLVLTFFK